MSARECKTHTKELAVPKVHQLPKIQPKYIKMHLEACYTEGINGQKNTALSKWKCVCSSLSLLSSQSQSKQHGEQKRQTQTMGKILEQIVLNPGWSIWWTQLGGLAHHVPPPQPGQVLPIVKTLFLNKEIRILSHRMIDFLMSFWLLVTECDKKLRSLPNLPRDTGQA